MGSKSIVIDSPESGANVSAANPADAGTAAQTDQTPAPKTVTFNLDEIPEKFRADPSKVFTSYAEAEAELGRKSNEIGSWRSLVDDLVASKRTADRAKAGANDSESAAPVAVTSDDVLRDPTGSIAKVVESVLERTLHPSRARWNPRPT